MNSLKSDDLNFTKKMASGSDCSSEMEDKISDHQIVRVFSDLDDQPSAEKWAEGDTKKKMTMSMKWHDKFEHANQSNPS